MQKKLKMYTKDGKWIVVDNIAFADELAELLTLANIPNFKKESIGASHLARVNAILEAKKKAEAAAMIPTTTEEVKEDVGEKS